MYFQWWLGDTWRNSFTLACLALFFIESRRFFPPGLTLNMAARKPGPQSNENARVLFAWPFTFKRSLESQPRWKEASKIYHTACYVGYFYATRANQGFNVSIHVGDLEQRRRKWRSMGKTMAPHAPHTLHVHFTFCYISVTSTCEMATLEVMWTTWASDDNFSIYLPLINTVYRFNSRTVGAHFTFLCFTVLPFTSELRELQ